MKTFPISVGTALNNISRNVDVQPKAYCHKALICCLGRLQGALAGLFYTAAVIRTVVNDYWFIKDVTAELLYSANHLCHMLVEGRMGGGLRKSIGYSNLTKNY